ncbi:MAG: hypothetical protein Q9180_009489, partial [Flavoplaca navasiana]
IREACDIAIVATPGVLKSRWFIFTSGMMICHLGKRAFDTVQNGDVEIFTGLKWAIWDVLTGLFRLFQKHEDVVYQWSVNDSYILSLQHTNDFGRLHPLGQTIFLALLELKIHWLFTLLVVGILSLTTAVVLKWRSMSWGARQDMWFKFLRAARCLWTLLDTCWAIIFAKLINLSHWCCTQDIRGIMINTAKLVAKFELEIAKLEVEILLLLPRGFYRVHHQIRESKRQKNIDKMDAEYEKMCATKGQVIDEMNGHICQQNLQIDTMNQQISGLTQERNNLRAKYEDAEERARMTWLQSEKHKNAILCEAQLQVDAANHKYERAKGLCRT